MKKSEHTGSGLSDVYVPKWKFFNECKFLEDVVALNRPTYSNLPSRQPTSMEDDEGDFLDNEVPVHATDTGSTSSEVSSEAASAHPKRKRKNSEGNRWMETAANALTQLTNQEDEQDEWDIFGKDVANSLRALKNPDWQRRAKFAIQTAIYQVTEKARHPVSQVPIVSTAQVIDPFFSSLGN